MKSRNTWLYMSLIFLAAVLITPLIRVIVHFIIIEPIAYYWWGIQQGLALVPQYFYWIFLVSSLGIIASIFLLKYFVSRTQDPVTKNMLVGPVESFADSISRTKGNNYFKWIIANKLATITLMILDPSKTENQKKKSLSTLNLYFKDFPDNLRNYLQTGMDSSFSHFRYTNIIPNIKQKNPQLDINIEMVVDYLEHLVE